MKQRIDSTYFFFQFVFSRISIVAVSGFLVYSIFEMKLDVIIFCLLALVFVSLVAKTKVNRPSDLKFDSKFLYLKSQNDPLEIKHIKAIENGVIIYDRGESLLKIPLPNYYFIDKNFKKLKLMINNEN